MIASRIVMTDDKLKSELPCIVKAHDENSMSREKRAAQCSVDSKEMALSLLGDTADDKYPIFMTGDRSIQ